MTERAALRRPAAPASASHPSRSRASCRRTCTSTTPARSGTSPSARDRRARRASSTAHARPSARTLRGYVRAGLRAARAGDWQHVRRASLDLFGDGSVRLLQTPGHSGRATSRCCSQLERHGSRAAHRRRGRQPRAVGGLAASARPARTSRQARALARAPARARRRELDRGWIRASPGTTPAELRAAAGARPSELRLTPAPSQPAALRRRSRAPARAASATK